MKRLLVLFAMLVPLSLFVVGCDVGSSRKASEPTAEEMQQRQEQLKKNMAKMQKEREGRPGGAAK